MEFIVSVFALVVSWRLFQKMGRKGWEGIIPFYNTYVMFDVLYGQGWKMLLFLIPIYNIYLAFKTYIDLSKEFHQGAGFGVGLVFLYPIFGAILAFGKAEFRDGSFARTGDDPISETIDSAADFVTNTFNGKPKRDPEALEKLEKLKNLHDSGVLSDEEYQKMKDDLMGRF